MITKEIYLNTENQGIFLTLEEDEKAKELSASTYPTKKTMFMLVR